MAYGGGERLSTLKRNLLLSTSADEHERLNELGVAFREAGKYKEACHEHRRAKALCKVRLDRRNTPERKLELAVTHRCHAEATACLDEVRINGLKEVVQGRENVACVAYEETKTAFKLADEAEKKGAKGAGFEAQKCLQQMAYMVSLRSKITKNVEDFALVAQLSSRSARRAHELWRKSAVREFRMLEMVLSAKINEAVAWQDAGDRKGARQLFEWIAIYAMDHGDKKNLARALGNLAADAQTAKDLQTCLEYAERWRKVAQDQNDEWDTSDALVMKAEASFELGKYENATKFIQQAFKHWKDPGAHEIKLALAAEIDSATEGAERNRQELVRHESACEQAFKNVNRLEEARLRFRSGDLAYALRRYPEALGHYERYFDIASTLILDSEVVGIKTSECATASTNIADIYHRMGKFEKAEEWATRSLDFFRDDPAGRAQALINKGSFLDDMGQRKQGADLIRQGMAEAMAANDLVLVDTASANLIIVEERIEEDRLAELNHSNVAVETEESNRTDSVRGQIVAKDPALDNTAPQHSIVIDSDHISSPASPRNTKSSGMEADVSRSALLSDGDSCRYFDLCEPFRKRMRLQPWLPSSDATEPRTCILQRLRSLSSKRATCSAGDVLEADFSDLHLDDEEFPHLVETCTVVFVNGPTVWLNLCLNPLLTSGGIRWLYSDRGVPQVFTNLVSLDLTGCKVETSSLKSLADSLRHGRKLSSVSVLRIGWCCLGDSTPTAAKAVSGMLLYGHCLESLELRGNRLSNEFLPCLASSLELYLSLPVHSNERPPVVRALDLKLNNRRNPTALLEGLDPNKAVESLNTVLRCVGSLRLIDLRACGAEPTMRRKLFALRGELLNRVEPVPSPSPADPVDLVVVAENCHDPEDHGLESK